MFIVLYIKWTPQERTAVGTIVDYLTTQVGLALLVSSDLTLKNKEKILITFSDPNCTVADSDSPSECGKVWLMGLVKLSQPVITSPCQRPHLVVLPAKWCGKQPQAGHLTDLTDQDPTRPHPHPRKSRFQIAAEIYSECVDSEPHRHRRVIDQPVAELHSTLTSPNLLREYETHQTASNQLFM